MRPLRLFLCSFCLYVPLALAAQSPEATEQQLKALKQQISRLQQQVGKRQDQLQDAQSELRRFDRQIGEVSAELDKLQQQIGQLEQHRGNLGVAESRLLSALQEREAQIRVLLQEQYRMGRQPNVQLILSQQDPQRLDRMLRYYDSVSSGLGKQLQQFRQQLEQLDQTRSEISKADTDLISTRDALTQRRQALDKAREGQSKVLAKLQRNQNQDQSRLVQLQQDQQQLEAVLTEIRRSLEQIRLQNDGLKFGQRKGQLEWPVSGSVRRTFGSRVDNVSYEGMLIATPAGTRVKAIHHGRVVFADWLRGYGLVLILDHGGGYLSLYGHNDSLLREPGEWVGTGEALALAGSSGGGGEPGLYFAIRYQGRSIDPISWLGKR